MSGPRELRPEDLHRLGDDLLYAGRFEEALRALDEAISLRPDFALAYLTRGRVLQSLRRDEGALAAYDRAFALDPDIDYLAGARWRLKLELCVWDRLDAVREDVERRIEAGKRATAPFMLLMSERADLARRAAETWLAPYPRDTAPRPAPLKDGRIRVGYFSGDFRNHAVTHLITGLIEHHDRGAFEATGYSFGPDDRSEARARIAAAFDAFHDVRTRPDTDIVALARSLQLDIAIDLTGFTQQGRPGVFSRRAAPVQVSYLGYPGTMGVDVFDYVVADQTVIPDADRRWYSEKVVALPDSYQANDDRRIIASRTVSRAEAGLPQSGFVFSCFNACSKLTPPMFDRWARILGRVEGSVLWLMGASALAERNLQREWAARGLDPARLVFAGRAQPAEHLARHRLADLFLDTLPYNAHTTASDALWAGLPVLTQEGATFAGRVAASLLRAVNLPELIVATGREYEELAVALAADPARLGALRSKLAANLTRTPLFDTAGFTRNFEAALRAMHQRHQAGLAPDHIHIPRA